jgi:GDP-4-dehydro-6-deoxy-D-mannose reductase
MEKILITGITGFVGSHLVDYLLENEDVKIYGTAKIRSSLENLTHNLDKIKLIECNILDSHNVEETIKDLQPDKIFHLAAQSFVPTSWRSPNDTLSTNILGQSNLFESVRKFSKHTKVLIAGSSEEYGLVAPHEVPITESQPLRPLSPYAVSKVAQDVMAYQYVKSYDLHIIRTRAFNHSGPRRPSFFVDSSFARQIVEIKLGLKEPVLKHGNLEAARDFTHVKDMTHAYALAINKCVPGEVYNVCRGEETKIQDVLNKLISIANIDIKTVQDPERMRPSDVPILLGDSTKFRNLTGWQPKYGIEEILQDTYDYWLEKLS